MKKSLVFLLVVVLGIFLLTGCLVKENLKEGNNVLTLSELRAKILENKDVWNDYDSHTTVYETEGIVVYQYTSNSDPTKNYIYIVDENGNGLKLTYLNSENHDGKYNIGDKIKVKGVPYYKTWSDPAIYELRMDIDNFGEIEVLEKNFGVPLSKSKNINSELTGNDFGNLVSFTGKYIKADNYSNKEFSVDGVTIVIDSHSVLPSLTEGSTYTIKGVVGQNYGYRVLVSDESWVTLIEQAPQEEVVVPPEYQGIIISEIQFKPTGTSNGAREWVELYNASDTAVNLKNLIITDGYGSYTFDNDYIIDPGEFVTLGSEATETQKIDIDWNDSNLALNKVSRSPPS